MIESRTWFDWLVALALSLASAGVVFWQNSRLAVLWDLSYILENSYRISLGDIPYRDFPFPYPPLTFVTQAALIKLSGRLFFHHVIYCAVVGGLSTLLTWRILLKILRGAPRGHWLALILTAPMALFLVFRHWRSVRSVVPRSRLRLILAGLLAVVDIGLLGILFWWISMTTRGRL